MRLHGTVRRYLQGPNLYNEDKPCRCTPCTNKHAGYLRQWRATGTKLIDVPEIIRRQMEAMLRGEWTIWALSAELGIGHQTLRHIVEGTTKRIRPATLEKLGMVGELNDTEGND